MNSIWEKLNLKDQQEILILNAPENFEPVIARLPVLTIHHHIESVPHIGFALAFVTRRAEVNALAPKLAARAPGDSILWFAYPKSTSKKGTSDLSPDTGWAALKKAGFDTVGSVAINEDWTGLRFRRKEFIKAR
jgi:hypothetical protein